jgi:hypothetical protein
MWQTRETVSLGGPSARFFVPRMYDPLLPGSIYPDRKRPAVAVSRPCVVLVGPSRLRGRALPPLGERGIPTLSFADGLPEGALERGIAWLAARKECAAGAAGLELVGVPVGAAARLAESEAPVRAVALLGYGASAGPPATKRPEFSILTLNLSRPGAASTAFSEGLATALGSQPVEKWYGPAADGSGFPEQAYRDAAEWLASTLERPSGQ